MPSSSLCRFTILPLMWLLGIAAVGQEPLILPQPSGPSAAGTPQLLPSPSATLQQPEYPAGTVGEPIVLSEQSLTDIGYCDSGYCGSCSDDGSCVSCGTNNAHNDTFSGRLYSAFSAALCDGDPCYMPEWHLLESASFWVDSARTQNRTRVRWDYGIGMILPDRSEYFMAKIGGKGPSPQPGSASINRLDYHEMSFYTETARGKFSMFTVTPYRSLYMEQAGHGAGFGDIQIGTKSMLHDTRMLQVTLQTTTSIPTGRAKHGVGTGHVSLEPALLMGLALTDRDFLQAQAAEWIPLGGDSQYAGALLRWGVAWNRIVWQRDAKNLMTVNLDFVGWSFQDGAYTDPVLGTQSSSNGTYVYVGPGTRFLFCGKFEFGIGGLYALSEQHFAEHLMRTELTMRY
ncbi:hypothetical protein [Rosistilla oblonga]|uniref:hypothetical protein n=1 Tax=Rosistilla oblonga TaxID=2527990 RepID=UPI003A971D25